MPTIIFSHPQIKSALTLELGIEECSWGYNLNTQTYPTYGGEVVQILSVYIDDLQLSGTVATYERMEQIYSWFLEYMSLATQEGYNQEPVFVNYPHRGWTWFVYPKSLPGFRYGRDVVAPEWQLTAKVWEADEEIKELTLEKAAEGLERIPLGIGYEADNPFSDPMGDKKTKKEDLEKFWEQSVDKFAKLIPSYMEGDYESLLGEVGSQPAFLKKSLDEDEEGDQENDAGS